MLRRVVTAPAVAMERKSRRVGSAVEFAVTAFDPLSSCRSPRPRGDPRPPSLPSVGEEMERVRRRKDPVAPDLGKVSRDAFRRSFIGILAALVQVYPREDPQCDLSATFAPFAVATECHAAARK